MESRIRIRICMVIKAMALHKYVSTIPCLLVFILSVWWEVEAIEGGENGTNSHRAMQKGNMVPFVQWAIFFLHNHIPLIL
jgi:hypothetical protein